MCQRLLKNHNYVLVIAWGGLGFRGTPNPGKYAPGTIPSNVPVQDPFLQLKVFQKLPAKQLNTQIDHFAALAFAISSAKFSSRFARPSPRPYRVKRRTLMFSPARSDRFATRWMARTLRSQHSCRYHHHIALLIVRDSCLMNSLFAVSPMNGGEPNMVGVSHQAWRWSL